MACRYALFRIPQLRYMQLSYSPKGGSSKGVRQFMVDDLVEFAKDRPHTVFEVRPISDNRHPYFRAKYLTGRNIKVDLKNLSPEEVARHAQTLADADGKKHNKLQQPVQTRVPSIQGNWNPFHADRPLPSKLGNVKVRQPKSD
mmetsp:Transcript_35690/g.93287  ORF Transcript_35690/g.93287 Transcript_35690/m.93287 type:complete len:143 (+) Transcript_35690:102-530(+)